MALLVVATLGGCERLRLGDCVSGGRCEPYRPQGLACGLAHEGVGHYGGSCDERHDPASSHLNDPGATAHPDEAEACPVGFVAEHVGDHEAGRSLASCASTGNAGVSSGRWRDVPAGSACGLSRLGGGRGTACESQHAEEGRCPPGTRFRWIPDFFVDRVDDACRADMLASFRLGVEGIALCEPTDQPDGGCVEGTCAPWAHLPGLLCGLHARTLTLDAADVRDDPAGASVPFDVAPLAHETAACLASLGGDVEAERVRAGITAEASCMGRPVGEGCPDGLELICTAEFFAETLPPNLTGYCWCGTRADRQWIEPLGAPTSD